MNGVIKKLIGEKGFGFIKDAGGNEYFFHRSGLLNTRDWDDLREGDNVSFEVGEGKKGPRAEDVQRV
jgi:CspA family cold shock protein